LGGGGEKKEGAVGMLNPRGATFLILGAASGRKVAGEEKTPLSV